MALILGPGSEHAQGWNRPIWHSPGAGPTPKAVQRPSWAQRAPQVSAVVASDVDSGRKWFSKRVARTNGSEEGKWKMEEKMQMYYFTRIESVLEKERLIFPFWAEIGGILLYYVTAILPRQ